MTEKKSRPIVTDDYNGTFSTMSGSYKDYISLVMKGYLYNDANHLELVKSLDLSGNNLSGSITSKIGSLKSLESLDFSNNHLSGAIPSTIADLNFLGTLSLANNNFSEEFRQNSDSSWVPPFHLDTIGLASCGLGSRFPGWLRTQTNYSMLDLSNTGISDTIPFWFWNLSSTATFIILSHNRLHGELPTDFPFVFDMFPAIDLSCNFLEGTIPSFFSKAEYLNLSRNGFSGPVSFLCQPSFQFDIDLSHNNLSGELPDCWSEAVGRISVLDLSNNSFSGQLPSSLAKLSYLQSLHLGHNKFSGKLPLSLCKLTLLSFLDLGDNLFSGEIPRCLGRMLNNLTVLSLRHNSISGSIPPEICHPSIQILDLSMNNISGVIPQCLCMLQAMTQKKSLLIVRYDSIGTFSTIRAPYKDYISLVLKGYLYNDANHLELVKSLDLSGNNLRGSIPGEISCLTGLISLNFSGNNLTGSVTSKIGSLKSLESLDLSNNHLSGNIPSTISDLNFLGTLSLANNNFSGSIPAGTQIQGFNASAFAGNPWLCGEPLPNKCPGDGDGKGSSINEIDKKRKDHAFDLGLCISIALGFITGFWAFCGVLVLKRSWRVAYFRAWIHGYDKLYVLVALMLVRIRRRHFE
ncbi:receptor-like protein EIX2 [Silene latifolia]|uniref:receptor-like protein EIX2 n=1 Tax=Silene latifolia TaxID=37657 RepID=UPI003D780D2F